MSEDIFQIEMWEKGFNYINRSLSDSGKGWGEEIRMIRSMETI